MDNKKTLLIDVDEVICFSGFLEVVNEFLETDYVIEDFIDYYIDEVAVPKDRFEEFNQFLNTKNLYKNAILLPNAVDIIKKLNELYNVFLCSSCVNPFNVENSGRCFKDKYEFLIQTLPFIKPENFIFTNSKHIVKADIMIDDRISNFDKSIQTKILFPAYHNLNISDEELMQKGALRAGYSWDNAWLEIEKMLCEKTYVLKK